MIGLLLNLLKKYWYVPLLLLLAGAPLVYFGLHHADFNLPDLLHRFGYPLIMLLTFLEGETVILIAASTSEKFGLRLDLIALCAFCGSFASDQIMFLLGRYKGQALLERFPKLDARLGRAKDLFKKYDTVLILGFRFAYGMRNITPIMLGLSGVGHMKFVALNFAGAAAWAILFTYGGYYLGQAFIRAMHRFGLGILLLLPAILLAALILWRVRRKKNG